MRSLLIIFLALVGIWWLRRALARMKKRSGGRGGRPAVPERMLECSHCRVNVPESEGVYEGGRFYCCDAHRRAGPRVD